MKPNRRKFLVGLGGAGLAAAGLSWLGPQKSPNSVAEVIDFHVHLFGVGDGQTGCWLSETQKRHYNYGYLLRLLGLKSGQIDEDYVQRLVTHLRGSSIKRAVVQSWDCRYDAKGEPDRENTTSAYVPNDYLLKVVARYPDLFIPCASINPSRKDALDELDRCAAQNVQMIKIHPPTMNVDPANLRFRGFYRLCQALRIIVMVHTGAEHAADIVDVESGDLKRLTLALELGCTVIASHGGLSAFFDKEDFFPSLRPMIRRFPNLYFDTAVLASMFRWRNLPRIMEDSEILSRVIHGSDFPFPSNALVFWNQLAPRSWAALLSEKNLIERDYRIKQALGISSEVFERGAKLLSKGIQ